MTLLGFVVLEDPLKPGIITTLQRLMDMGIAVKIISGDSRHVAAHVGAQIGLGPKVVTGNDLRHMGDEALLRNVDQFSLFAEVEPNQKERIILALKKAGHIVGYSGDGIKMPRPCMLRMSAFQWIAQWMWQKRRPISFCWRKILTSSLKASKRAAAQLPTR